MGEAIAEVGYLAGLCGRSGTDWLKVQVDSNGYLKVIGAGVAGAIEVTQDTPDDLLVGQHQYDGSAWHKSNMLWGYNAWWAESLGGVATGANYSANSDTVPEGEVWVCQAISIRNSSRAAANVAFSVYLNGGTRIFINFTAASAQYIPVVLTGTFTLAEDGYINVAVGGCQVGDVLDGGLIGYKMKLNM